MEVLARDYTLLQIIYLSRYKTSIQTTSEGSPTAISIDQSPEEVSKRLSMMAHLVGMKRTPPKTQPEPEPEGVQEDVRREVG